MVHSPLTESLPPRAQNMLHAAQRVVDRDGIDKLSLRSVATEAGETTSLVLYHFQSMGRLQALLLDALWRDLDLDFAERIGTLTEGPAQRVDALIDFHADIAAGPGRFRRYFDLVAGAIGKPQFVSEIAKIYRGYRDTLNAPLVTDPSLTEAETDALAATVLAVAEGAPFFAEIARAAAADGAGVGAEPVSPTPGLEDLRWRLHQRLDTGVNSSQTAAMSRAPAIPRAKTLAQPVELHPTARHLLNVGHDLVRAEGLRALSLETIARVSGEARPAVGYHFGNKSAFVASIACDAWSNWATVFSRPELWAAFATNAEVSLERDDLALLSELVLVFPVTVREPAVAQTARQSIETVRLAATGAMAESGGGSTGADGPRETHATFRLIVSALVGLALQHSYDPEQFDTAEPLRQLAALATTKRVPHEGRSAE